jgi:hypothetical protein
VSLHSCSTHPWPLLVNTSIIRPGRSLSASRGGGQGVMRGYCGVDSLSPTLSLTPLRAALAQAIRSHL